jgi:hypothetical protein
MLNKINGISLLSSATLFAGTRRASNKNAIYALRQERLKFLSQQSSAAWRKLPIRME